MSPYSQCSSQISTKTSIFFKYFIYLFHTADQELVQAGQVQVVG